MSEGHRAASLRRALAARLIAQGDLRSEAWRAAVEAVPRHEFLRGGWFDEVPGSVPTAWTPFLRQDGPEAWIARCYEDESLVTQLAGTLVPADLTGTVRRMPSSSSTLPSLVVGMLEALEVEDGMRVLEIGTGTGYNAALLCHRVGDENLTTVEVDPDVADRAEGVLNRVGYFPDVAVGDGLAGYPANAPYDRLIVTCGVRRIPGVWSAQIAVEGLILVTVRGWLGGSGLARLTVTADGNAEGAFLSAASFMPARGDEPPGGIRIPSPDDGVRRPTEVGPEVLADDVSRFLVEQIAPHVQHARLSLDGGPVADHLVDARDGSFAVVTEGPAGSWQVRQGGGRRLWDAIEDGILRWRADGRPGIETFRVAVDPAGQQVWWEM